MFSESLKESLYHEVVGQSRAVENVVRGVTRMMSGLTPSERSWCAYLFMGPPGTGRAHLVRTLARVLHGDEFVFTLDCNPAGHADPWACFLEQLAPLFARQEAEAAGGLPPGGGPRRPPSVILVQDLERAPKTFFLPLARLLETGQLSLPGGRRGRLHDCILILTSSLCTAEILEDGRIGFAGGATRDNGDEEDDAIFRICHTEAENTFGLDLLAQIDNLIVFRRLELEHLAKVLERHFERMNRWLHATGSPGSWCELLPSARDFLLERGMRQKLLGARDLILAHRQEVEFPLGDLLLSGRLPGGSRVRVAHEDGAEHLHFTIEPPEPFLDPVESAEGEEIPVEISAV